MRTFSDGGLKNLLKKKECYMEKRTLFDFHVFVYLGDYCHVKISAYRL